MSKSVRSFWRALLSVSGFKNLGADQFAPDAAKRFRRKQIKDTLDQTQLLLLGNTLFAPTLAFQALTTGSAPVLVAWTVLMVGGSWALHFWTRPLYYGTGEASDLTRMKTRAFIDGSLWCAGMACVYPHAAGDGKAIVGIIVTGAVALGTFGYSGSVGPAMIYLAATALGGGAVILITGLTTGSPSDIVVAVLSVSAFIALAKSVRDRGRADLESFQNVETLSEKTEAVDLLLKDYEAQATEWRWQTDANGQLTVAPKLFVELLGGPAAIKGDETLLRFVGRRTSPESADDFERMESAVRDRREFHDVILAVPDPTTHTLRWIAVKGRPQFDNGTFRGFRGLVADATKAVTAERQVQFLAAYDGLTGLLNRNSVQKRLGDLDPHQDKVTALLIDLDGFKQINDSYGHDIGDALLRAASARLKELAKGDAWAARLAGDEFLMVFPDEIDTADEDLLILGQEVCEYLSQPIRLKDFELQVSASIGMARFPSDTESGLELLSLSDLALYEAKDAGRDCARMFDQVMLAQQNQRTALIEQLEHAVRNGRIQLHYQPQHRLSDGQLIGFEALARWIDEDLGTVGPDAFIPIAEQTGLIVELGEQLLYRACQDAQHWYKAMEATAPVVSVNISPVQFARTDVAGLVAHVLSKTDLPARLLEVEVTEGVLISDKSRVADTLKELHAMGVSIALDDFGTGYSSLAYLKALPLTRLKIDRSFVSDLDEEPESPIVSTVIQLGRNLGLRVIAEGLETRSQTDRLLALGCDEGQGYFYGGPMRFADTDDYIDGLIANGATDEAG